jgi:hypothetical protein
MTQVLQYSQLTDIDDISPINSDDLKCLDEVRSVIMKHKRLDRFGVSLLHKHFEVATDEILVETCDPAARVLVTKPVKLENIPVDRQVQTLWRFDGNSPMICVRDERNVHDHQIS